VIVRAIGWLLDDERCLLVGLGGRGIELRLRDGRARMRPSRIAVSVVERYAVERRRARLLEERP
jgi:hypothetical protein